VSDREKIASQIMVEGLVAIVRVRRPELALPLAKALVAGGIRAVELTMSIPNALEAVRTIDRELGGEIDGLPVIEAQGEPPGEIVPAQGDELFQFLV